MELSLIYVWLIPGDGPLIDNRLFNCTGLISYLGNSESFFN